MNGESRAIVRLRIVCPSSEAPYSLEELARLAGVPSSLARRYFDEGLIEPVAGHRATGWFFDDRALLEVRRIQRLRRDLGVNIAAVGVIQELFRQIEELKDELARIRENDA